MARFNSREMRNLDNMFGGEPEMTSWPYSQNPGVPSDPQCPGWHILKFGNKSSRAEWCDGEWRRGVPGWGDHGRTSKQVAVDGIEYGGPCERPDPLKDSWRTITGLWQRLAVALERDEFRPSRDSRGG
jgi:hypothetical protein